MKSLIKRLRSEEKGQIVILVAFSMVMFFGLGALAADIGRLYLERQRLSAIADMASLSATQFLPDRSLAASKAREYLTANGVDGSLATVTVNEDAKVVQVEISNTIPMTFAKMIGYNERDTYGRARARIDNVSGVFGAAPLGIAQADWQIGQQVILKLSPNDGTVAPGNYQALALGKSGASMYEYNLMNGFQDWIRANTWISVEPGSMATPTVRATRYRMSLDPNSTWQTVTKNSPRLLKVPVLQNFQVNGAGQVYVVGFAMFYLEGALETGSDKGEITGRFLRMLVEGEANATVPDFGLKAAKLIR